MDVVSASPFRVGSILWQDGAGASTLTVVAKATYLLQPGESVLDRHQDAPFEADEHWDDDENRSLHTACDLAPFKRNADVLVLGHAFAPGGQPVRSLRARVLLGEVDKSVEVVCDRAFSQDGRLREGAPFVKMALRWERAAGGPGTANPAGVRADAPPDRYGLTPLPNLVPPGLHMASRRDFVEPAGFGPIGPSWPARQSWLHRGLAGWDYRRWALQPLPADLDPGFFNAAPADQQLGAIRPNERIVLENLHRDHARLATNLTTVTPRAVVEWAGRPSQELRMRCDTLCIDTDRGTCSLTWRVAIPLDPRSQAGRVVITLAQSGHGAEDAARQLMSTTAELPAPPGTLPFMQPVPLPTRASAPDLGVAPGHQTLDTPLGAAMPALPFRVGRSPLAGTVLGRLQPAPEEPAPRSDDDDDDEDDEQTFTVLPDDVASFLDVHPAAPPPLITMGGPESPPKPPDLVRARALLEPLATPERVAREQAAAEEVVEEAEILEEAPAEEARAPLPTEAPGLPLDAYPLERCAAIAASIARRKPETSAILDAHDLAPARWEALGQHWQDAIRAESARGKTSLLSAYDDAYVTQLEVERGPLQVEDYARLVVASERGVEDAELATLGLPRSALLRISRVWLRRTTGDAELERAVRDGIEAARDA
jgi:hypothetical protein